ncbi:MAG: ABC transporter substrate-binding protein, partial [Ignavibacteria bacterium]|nr:ABC transporter substrate-binding protein [Ignavibacteria bacterium]
MNRSKKLLKVISLFILIILCSSCERRDELSKKEAIKPVYGGSVIIGIAKDVDFFNPLFSQDVTSSLINDLIFSALTSSDFDLEEGKLIYIPSLAKSWTISSDEKSIIYNLDCSLKWSDGNKFTADDVKYSYLLYTHSKVGSIRQDYAEYFIKNSKGEVDASKSFEVINDSTIKFNFSERVKDPLFITGLPIVAKHIFDKLKFEEINLSDLNFKPVGIGPFKLEKWNEKQEIILSRNENSNFKKKPYLDKLIFKILPEYNNRINQLKSGEIDLVMGNLRPEDAMDIKSNYPSLRIETLVGRDYDYVGWNNIDQKIYEKSKGKIIKPHPLFGSKIIRKALTYAINRKEIIDGYFGEFADFAVSPVSPLFKKYFNSSIKPLEFNQEKAKELLKQEGWIDSDGDKILDKNKVPFKFTLSIPSNKPQREYAATVIKNNLSAIGIDVTIETVEPGIFIENVFAKKYDAFIVGWNVALDLDLESYWSSDLKKYIANTVSYQNKEVDNIFNRTSTITEFDSLKNLWFRFQEIINEDQPVTFLYWAHS